MTKTELDDYFKKLKVNDYIVLLRYKYKYEKSWEYSAEVMSVGGDGNIYYYNDWYEGQEDIDFMGMIAIDDIPTQIYKNSRRYERTEK